MLRIKSLLLPVIMTFVLLVLASGCSTSPKQKHSHDVAADDIEVTQKKRPANWQRNRVTQLDSASLDLSVFDEEYSDIPVNDLWQRVRGGFAMSDHLDLHPNTQTRLEWFAARTEYLERVSERASPYLYYIVAELDKRNMPMEIALLPIVESGYQPLALSTSNASGIWQFIPGTGKVFGLEQNWWYDGRRDIIRSTDAALNYLERLHGLFNDWELAIAAYNAGEGTVGRAIQKNIEEGRGTDFWSLDLPAETTDYIPKLLALSHLFQHPERYNLSLKPIANEPYLTVVDVGSQINLALAADLAEISIDDLNLLNPGFNRWATAPNGPHKLVVPIEKATQFKTALADLPAEKRIELQRHEVKPGESLGAIALQHNTSVTAIKNANNMQNTFLRAGAHILIPVGNVQAEQSSQRTAATGKKSAYRVQPGDSWWNIAKRFNADVSDLADWNGKTPGDILHPGQTLVIWEQNISPQLAHLREINYIIRQGDSLWKISRQFNVRVADVKAWNNLSDRSPLHPGQQLTIYVSKT